MIRENGRVHYLQSNNSRHCTQSWYVAVTYYAFWLTHISPTAAAIMLLEIGYKRILYELPTRICSTIVLY